MKRNKVLALLTGLLLAITLPLEGYAQTEENTLNMQIEFNRGSYDMLVQQAGERGVSASDLAGWIAENGNLYLEIDGVAGESIAPQEGKLMLYLVSERGIVGQNGYPVRLSERPAAIGRMVGADQIGRLISRSIPGDAFIPGDTFIPGDSFIPGDAFITSSRDAEQMAVEAGMRAIGSGGGSGSGKVSIVVMLVPDRFNPDQPVSSKPTAMAGDVK